MLETERVVEYSEREAFLKKKNEDEKVVESVMRSKVNKNKKQNSSLYIPYSFFASRKFIEDEKIQNVRRKKRNVAINKEGKADLLTDNECFASSVDHAGKEVVEEEINDLEKGDNFLKSTGKCKEYQSNASKANQIISSLIAMLQGVEVLCSLTIMYLYKDDFKINPALLGILLGALKVPWTVKPAWALMSDAFPLFGYRRKSYIFLGAIMCLVSTLGMGTFGFNYMWTTTMLLFFYFLGSAICNVIGEALVVEVGRSDKNTDCAAKSISMFFAFRKLSFAVMSYFSGFLLDYMPKQHVFLIASVLPLSVFIASFWLSEPKVEVFTVKAQLKNLYEVMKIPMLQSSTLFIFLMMCTPSAGATMFYFMTNELKFSPELLGRMALLQSIASLCGIIVYMYFFSATSIRKLLLLSTIAITPFCLLPIVLVQRWNISLNIPDTAFVVTDTVLMEFVGEFQSMPILVLAARLCPRGLESTIYSFILSAYNLGLGISSLISAGLTIIFGITSTSFNNLSILILVCTISNLLPLALIFLIPSNCVSIDEGFLTVPLSHTSEENENSKDLCSREAKTNAKNFKNNKEEIEEEGSTTGSEAGRIEYAENIKNNAFSVFSDNNNKNIFLSDQEDYEYDSNSCYSYDEKDSNNFKEAEDSNICNDNKEETKSNLLNTIYFNIKKSKDKKINKSEKQSSAESGDCGD